MRNPPSPVTHITFFFRHTECGTDGSRNAEPHRGTAVGHDLEAGPVYLPHLSDDVGVGTYIAGHNPVVGEDLPQLRQHRTDVEAPVVRPQLSFYLFPIFPYLFKVPRGG